MTIDINSLTIAQAREIAALFNVPTAPLEAFVVEGVPQSPLIGKHVVIRTYSAGVHIGELVAKDGQNVLLKDARRLWSWKGAFTLSEVATGGVASGSRMSTAVDLIELTQAVEIIPTTEAARKVFDTIRE